MNTNENVKHEKIIDKIRKILELSKKNPNQHEAESAALKAQALMAEYHVQLTDLEDFSADEEITEEVFHTGTGNKWKYSLASIVSRNFRCKHFYYGKSAVAFYGYETDVKIAKMTFEYLFVVGKKAMNNYYMNKRNEYIKYNGEDGYYDDNWKWHNCGFDGSGLKNSFILGFLDGIREVLDAQCTALMIVVPKEVNESYDKMVKEGNFGKMRLSGLNTRYGSSGREARECGKNVGRNAMQNRQLECAM